MHHESVFDMYAIAPPEGDWAYVVDDHTVTFGPGWWPLYRNGKPSAVRVAPGSEYLSLSKPTIHEASSSVDT